MARVKEDSWVIRRRDLNRNYGRVEFIDGDFASVTWGWRVGGNFGGIESIDNLVVVAPPEQVCEFGKQIIQECIDKYKKQGKKFAYDAATMQIMRFIYKKIYGETE
jgi:hypothetical protein